MVERNNYVQSYTLVVNKADNNRFSGPYWEIISPSFLLTALRFVRAVLENAGFVFPSTDLKIGYYWDNECHFIQNFL